MTNVLNPPESCISDELVVRARSERGALGQLYDQVYPPVFRYRVRRTGDRNLAEDITSTVFLNVANKIAAFPGETYMDFRRWVFVIATDTKVIFDPKCCKYSIDPVGKRPLWSRTCIPPESGNTRVGIEALVTRRPWPFV